MPPRAGIEREVPRHPAVEAPPAEQRARVHQRDEHRRLGDPGREQHPDPAAIGRRGLQPDLRLLDLAPDPDREQRRQDADEEHAAPPPERHHDQVDQRGEAVADRPRALHEGQRLAAVLRRKRFRDERRAGRPLAAHAEAEQDAEHGELHRRLREAARGGEDRVDQHRGHQRALAPEPVGDDAERDAAGGGGQQRDRPEDAGRLEREVQHRIADERREHDRVEHHVERVEHPAERGGDEGASCALTSASCHHVRRPGLSAVMAGLAAPMARCAVGRAKVVTVLRSPSL